MGRRDPGGAGLPGTAPESVGRTAARAKTVLKGGAALVLLGFLVGALLFDQSIRTKAREGRPAPEWTAVDLSGRPVSLGDFRGRTVLLNFWTTWCVSCREETPALQTFHERYGDRVLVIGLDIREPLETVRAYMRETGMTFLVLRDRSGRVPPRYGLRGYPETWFVDADGVARAFWRGPMTFEIMQALYEKTTGRPIDGDGVGPVAAGNHLHAVAPDPTAPAGILAGAHDGLWRNDGAAGARWQPPTADRGLARADVMVLVRPDGRPGTILAAGHDVGVVRSRDGGRTWRPAGAGLPGRDVHALAAAPDGLRLYAWVADRGLYRSEDGGDSWRAVAGQLDGAELVVALAVDPRDPERLLLSLATRRAVGWEGRLLASPDSGRTLASLPLGETIYGIETNPVVFAIAFDPAHPAVVYLATDRGIWKSVDAGRSARWLRGSHARKLESVAAAPGGVVLAAAANGDIYRSRDGGVSWTLLTR